MPLGFTKMVEIALAIIGLLLTVMMPALGWAVSTIYGSKQDNATQQNQIDILSSDVESGKTARREMHMSTNNILTDIEVLKTQLANFDSGIALSIENLNDVIADLRGDLNTHKSDTNKFIKAELDSTKTIIMDKLELMMLRQCIEKENKKG